MSGNNDFCPHCNTRTMETLNDGGTRVCRMCNLRCHFCSKDATGKRIGEIYKCECRKVIESKNSFCVIL